MIDVGQSSNWQLFQKLNLNIYIENSKREKDDTQLQMKFTFSGDNLNPGKKEPGIVSPFYKGMRYFTER